MKQETGFGTASTRQRHAFTLIELLVVVSIIALLISILLPSLTKAREQTKAIKCAANQHQVGTAMAVHLADNNGIYAPSYVYPYNDQGDYDIKNQDPGHPYGYVHWSWSLYSSGKAKGDAFECPRMNNGGNPRTNPGKLAEDWEPGQTDDQGQSGNGTITDKQAPRMSITGNAGVFPRNKFTETLSGGQRVNVLVSDTVVKNAGQVILAAEFFNNWEAASISSGGGVLSKSHRPVHPFEAQGVDEYTYPPEQPPGLSYPKEPDYGVAPLANMHQPIGAIDGAINGSEINAVGRHHPGGDKVYGGTANFLFCDSHVERMTIKESIKRQLWGDRYYSLEGNNKIDLD